jgi:predicted porin
MSTRLFLRTAVATAIAGCLSLSAHGADDSLTWNGITLYGTYSIGVAYQNHGAPLSSYMGQGIPYMLGKMNNKSQTSLAPNANGWSRIGLRGKENITEGLDFIFNAEIGFQPQSGNLSDALKSLVANNGVPLARQTSATDSARAGQLFNGPAYAGISSTDYGVFTLGRQNTVATDLTSRFDPMDNAVAFSILGYSGVPGAIGYTEDKVYDSSLKYAYKYDRFHVSGIYQPSKVDSQPGKGWQIGGGFDYGPFAIDAAYGEKNTALSLASLSAAQVTAGLRMDSLSATVADTSGWVVGAKLDFDAWKLFGGHERIAYSNPSNPLSAGFAGMGGYWISAINNTAFPHDKILQIDWLGAKYFFSKQFDIAAAWYHYDQNAYGAKACSNTSEANCSGTENIYSVRLDYRLNKRVDVYGGVSYVKLNDGLASGYLHNSVYTPIVGFRIQF